MKERNFEGGSGFEQRCERRKKSKKKKKTRGTRDGRFFWGKMIFLPL